MKQSISVSMQMKFFMKEEIRTEQGTYIGHW